MTGPTRFALRRDNRGWTVLDLSTGRPATIVAIPQTGLLEADAMEIARQFNLRGAGDGARDPRRPS